MHLIAGGTQLLSVSNRFMIFDLNSGDLVRVINPAIEGIMQTLSVSADTKYCVSFTNKDSIIICNLISSEFKILKRFTKLMPGPSEPKQLSENLSKPQKQAPISRYKYSKSVNTERAETRLKLPIESYKDYTDTLIGSHASTSYFVVYSKFFIYVYAFKSTRLIKVKKLVMPIIQVEVIENNSSISKYGVELEVITRDRDIKENEEVERENLIVYYMAAIDSEKCMLEEEEAIRLYYIPSADPLECHSCVRLTRSKKKLFTCTEIDDNVIECFRNRQVVTNKQKTKNMWKYVCSFK